MSSAHSSDEPETVIGDFGPQSVLLGISRQRGRRVDPRVDLDGAEGVAGVAIAGAGDSDEVAAAARGGNRYSVDEEIARGGVGAVYRVRDRDLRRTVAMKVLLPRGPVEPGSGPPLESRFLEEAQITAQLNHPGVVPVHDLGVTPDGRPYFTMALVRGRTLAEILSEMRRDTHGWTLSGALQVFLRICETVAFAHARGVIHRDLKPRNVMVGRFGEVLVVDWGLARVRGRPECTGPAETDASRRTLVDSDRMAVSTGNPVETAQGTILGTPAYMPPEQARGRIDSVDERSDVYSIGAMLYELLAGHPPYLEPGTLLSPAVMVARIGLGPPPSIDDRAPDAPEEVRAIVSRSMARDPADRFPSASVLGDAIAGYLAGLEAGRRAAELRAATDSVARRDAEDLISFFLEELEAARPAILHNELFENVARRLEARFAASDPPPDSLDVRERRNRAVTLLWLVWASGDPEKSVDFARRAVAVSRPGPGDDALRPLHARALTMLSCALLSKRDVGAAEDAAQEACALLDAGLTRSTHVREPARLRALAERALSNSLRATDPVRAEEHARRAESLLRDATISRTSRLDLAALLNDRANAEELGAQWESAVRVRAEGVAILDREIEDRPWNPEGRYLRGYFRVRRAESILRMGRVDEAGREVESAAPDIAFSESLGDTHGEGRWLRARSAEVLGDCARGRDSRAASGHFEEAAAALREIVADGRWTVAAENRLALCLAKWSDLLLARGDVDRGTSVAGESIALMRKLGDRCNLATRTESEPLLARWLT